MKKNNKNNIIIIGAGPSGLSAAKEFIENDIAVSIIEKNNKVGGLARTIKYKDSSYDIGPHRFYTLNKEVNSFYNTFLGNDGLDVKRLTRIFYNNKYFLYPLSPINTLFLIGFVDAIKILLSYFNSLIIYKLFKKKVNNFEDWIIANFGKKLFITFFKSYTEKVWGIDCKNINKSWAAQRIKNLSFFSVIFNPIIKKLTNKKIKSLVDQFRYPKFGAGFFYEKLSNYLQKKGCEIFLDSKLIKIHHSNNKIDKIDIENQDKLSEQTADDYFFSNPFTEIISLMDPSPPQKIIEASNKLRYRNHICVNLEIKGKLFPDNWIYVHDPKVKMARVSNYKNFSKYMSSSDDINPITVEYFAFKNEKIWKMNDQELAVFAINELLIAKIINNSHLISNSFIVRSKNAYPVIEKGYEENVNIIKEYFAKFLNLHPIGRSGMFKYNNQDHAIATGIYEARNVINKNNQVDIWSINSEGVYVESNINLE